MILTLHCREWGDEFDAPSSGDKRFSGGVTEGSLADFMWNKSSREGREKSSNFYGKCCSMSL